MHPCEAPDPIPGTGHERGQPESLCSFPGNLAAGGLGGPAGPDLSRGPGHGSAGGAVDDLAARPPQSGRRLGPGPKHGRRRHARGGRRQLCRSPRAVGRLADASGRRPVPGPLPAPAAPLGGSPQTEQARCGAAAGHPDCPRPRGPCRPEAGPGADPGADLPAGQLRLPSRPVGAGGVGGGASAAGPWGGRPASLPLGGPSRRGRLLRYGRSSPAAGRPGPARG